MLPTIGSTILFSLGEGSPASVLVKFSWVAVRLFIAAPAQSGTAANPWLMYVGT